MANTFLTPDILARDAAIMLENMFTVGRVINREKEKLFTASKVGDEITVTVPAPVSVASEFTGSTSAEDATEIGVGIKLEKHFYKRVDLTTKQKSLELDDFNRLVMKPKMEGIMLSLNLYFLKQLQVFRKNLAGSVGNRPSTLAHIAAADKAMNDLKIPLRNRVALIDTTVKNSFIQLAQFSSMDYGSDSGAGLREGMLGRRLGFDWQVEPDLGAFDRGDIGGTIAVVGNHVAGATSLAVNGFTSATGTVRAGTAFTIAGTATRYVVRKDATIADNATTLEITPALTANEANGDVATIEAAGYSNVVFNPMAVVGAIVAPEPLMVNSSVQNYGGVSVRVSMSSSTVTLADSLVIDVFAGGRVIQPDAGALFCG